MSKAAENQVKVQLCDVFMMLLLLLLLPSHPYIYFLFVCFFYSAKSWKLFRTSHTTQSTAEKNHRRERKSEKCDDVLVIFDVGVAEKNLYDVFIVFDISRTTEHEKNSLSRFRRRRRWCRAHIHTEKHTEIQKKEKEKIVESINTCRKLENTMFL